MTEQAPTPTGKKIAMTAADIGTMGLCATFAIAATNLGPVATGIAFAAMTLPFLSSLVGIMHRHHPSIENTPNGTGNTTGLQLAGRGLKNIVNDARKGDFTRAFVTAVVVGTTGFISGYVSLESENLAQRHEAYLKLPVLSGDTQIRVDEFCGYKRNIPFDKPFTHNGTQYRINCP